MGKSLEEIDMGQVDGIVDQRVAKVHAMIGALLDSLDVFLAAANLDDIHEATVAYDAAKALTPAQWDELADRAGVRRPSAATINLTLSHLKVAAAVAAR